MALATAKSTANAVWEGSLMEGSGQVGASSGAFSDLGGLMGCQDRPRHNDDKSGRAARLVTRGLLLHGPLQWTHPGRHPADQARS